MNYQEENYHYEDWRLSPTVKWEPKKGVETHITCGKCDGKGRWITYGGWGCADDDPTEHTCSKCRGLGRWWNPEVELRPARIPQKYLDHMSKAHWDFLNNIENRRYL